jgi:glycosyltransferase involved in cell wall biosynthesis
MHNMENPKTTDGHTLSIIIPTLERSTLLSTNKALEKQTRKPDEVIIIKDLKHLGYSWARNRGIEKAKGDLVAFMDDDCIPPPFWLESLISALDRYQADGVGGSYQETDLLLDDIRRRRSYPKKEVYDAGQWVGLGGNVLYTKQIFDNLY